MRLRMFGATNIGLVRSNNQDAYYCSAEYGLVVVSDGMGGHKGGEVASQLVVTGLREAFLASRQIVVEDVAPFLDEALRKINSEILQRSADDEKCRGMGATVNYLQFAGGQLAIGHAGDSRTYLIRAHRKPDGRPRFSIWCLTVDHNVGTFVERGLLKLDRDIPAASLTERQKSRLMRGMGVVPDLKADLYFRTLVEGDVFLTCSDGLHGFVSDKEILKTVVNGPVATAPERLIERAKAVGAPDNVTVVISILAETEEPLRDFDSPVLEKTPYLVRLPDGELCGPFTASEIVEKISSNEFPMASEASASLGKWVFFNERTELLKTYHEFDLPKLKTHLAFANSALSEGAARIKRKVSESAQNQWMLVGGAVFAAFAAALLIQYFMATLYKTLLPAY